MKMQLISVNLGQNAERGSHATGIDVKLVYVFKKYAFLHHFPQLLPGIL